MSDEDRLRARLRDRVDAVPVVADLDDLAARIRRRHHGRSRALAMVSVVALIVGTVGGFAVGRAGRGTTPEVVTAGASSSATDAVGSLAEGIAKGQGVAPTPMKRLFLRTTSDGVTIRAYEVTLLERHGAKLPSPLLGVEAEISTDAAVTLTTSGWSGPPALALGGMSPGSFGEPEQASTQYVIVQARSDVARVRVSFGDGGSDEMQPQHGVAVLAHLGAALPVTVSALDAQGQVTFTDSVPTPDCGSGCSSGTTLPAGGGSQPTSGPSLPAPGVDQPSDVSAAKQAVSAAVAGAFDGSASDATRVRSVEGGGALVSVFEQLRHGQFAASVQSATTVVEGVVFLSPTTATAKFHSHLGSGTDSGPYLADALLTSSGWQLTRASYCQLAAAAGATCP